MDITKSIKDNIEQALRILGGISSSQTSNEDNHLYSKYVELLKEKRNLVLTGAPGTGKTFIAKSVAAEIVSNGTKNWDTLVNEGCQQIGFVQFHPSYDYTDFVEGLRPGANGEFHRQDGVFKEFCKRALGEGKIATGSDVSLFDKVYSELIDDIRNENIKKYERISRTERSYG